MTPQPHDTMVLNIIHTYEQASDADMLDGQTWYSEAHHRATNIALNYGVTIEIAAAVIAAVSPRNKWEQNIKLAYRLFRQDVNGEELSGYLTVGLNKVRAVLDGTDPFEVLGNQKIRAFYQCIVASGQTDIVCVDRHAIAIAYGFKVREGELSLTERQYDAYSNAYQEAARTIGQPAAVVQAITWVTYRNAL